MPNELYAPFPFARDRQSIVDNLGEILRDGVEAQP
jgi:hypothetical protein